MRRILLCSLVFTATALAQAPASAGSIDGKVLSKTGAPLRRAIVTLKGEINLPPNLDPQVRSTLFQEALAKRKSYSAETDGEGRFLLPVVEAGNYTMLVTRPGYITDQREVVVGAGSKMSGMVMTLMAQSIIEGRILDEYGDPVPQAEVIIYRRDYSVAGGWTFVQMKEASSGADGRYSIGDLEAGRYYVRAADPRTTGISPSGIGQTQVQQERKPEYATTYYPNVTNQSLAAGVDLAASSEARGIDVRIQRVPVYRVKGKVVASGTLQTNSIRLVPVGFLLPRPTPQSFAEFRAEDGTFEFPHVHPGAYKLQYTFGDAQAGANSPMMVGRLDVNVSDKDLDDVVLQVVPAGEMKGRLKTEANGTAGAPAPQLKVTLSSADPLENLAATPVNADGSFVLKPVVPGDFRVVAYPMPTGWYLRSVRYGNQDVTNRKVTLGYGGFDELEIVLGSDAATVKGELRDDKGEPITAAQVMVWSTTNPAFNHFSSTAQGGTFQVSGLPPGDYRALAFGSDRPFPDNGMNSPEFLTQFSGRATSIKLGSSDTQTVSVKVVPKSEVVQALAKLR